MSIKQNGVLIAGGGQGGGHAVVSMDGITITNNANHEIQTVAKINQNNATGAVGYLYDWCGTLEEYTTQNIATTHPDWICYITNDDAGGVAENEIAWLTYGVTQFNEISALFSENKLICCKYDNRIYHCRYYITGATQYFYLTCPDTYSSVKYIRVSSTNEWIYGGQTNQPTITGAATTITSNNLAAGRVVTTNASGKINNSQVLASEIEYLSGATSNIQTQLNNKVSTGFEVVAFQLPTASNNFIWYKKYINGWVEQGCLQMAPGIFALPIEMNSTIYAVNVTPLGNNDNASVHANIISATSVEVDNENSWDMSVEVKGVAAII